MAPPLLPDFPLLVSTGTLTHPPPIPSSHYPRDPLTTTIITPPINPQARAAQLRHQRKLARLYHALHRPSYHPQVADDTAAKEAAQFSELHARWLEKINQAKHTQIEARHLDPYTFFNTPRILPPDVFHRRIDPPCTVALTGIPPSVPGYNSVCMAHRLAWNPRAGKPAPVLADWVSNSMSVRGKWDHAGRLERTTAFDDMRLGYALCSAKENGRRVGRGCLRCEVVGGRCSAATAGGRGEIGRCEGCKRRGEKWCLRVLSEKEGARAWDDKGVTARFLYLDVETKKSGKKRMLRVCVRDTDAHKHEAEIAELAKSLLQGDDESDIRGVRLNNNMILPDWKKAYAEETKGQQALHEEFVQECQTMYNLDRALIHHQTVKGEAKQDGQADSLNQHEHVDHHAYFTLLHNLHARSHPLRPRVPKNRLVLGPKDAAALRYHYWMMILDPAYRPPRQPLEPILKRVQLYHSADPTKEDVLEFLQLAWDAGKGRKQTVHSDGGYGRQKAAAWTSLHVAPWIMTAEERGLAYLVVFLVLGVWRWCKLLTGLGLHVCLRQRWEHLRETLDGSHISVVRDEGCEEGCMRLPEGKSLHDELRDYEALADD